MWTDWVTIMPGSFSFEVKKHRRGLLHDRDPLLVANPCGVEQDVVAKVTDLINDTASVVDGAVVGAELEHGEANGSLGLGTLGIDLRDTLADVGFVEAVRVDTTDETERISLGFKVDRLSIGHDEAAMVNRLVVVAVEQDDISRRKESVQNNLVG